MNIKKAGKKAAEIAVKPIQDVALVCIVTHTFVVQPIAKQLEKHKNTIERSKRVKAYLENEAV